MSFDLTAATAVLARTPGTVRALLAGLPDCWTLATEGPGTWSPATVVAHLLHADQAVWPVRARMILEHGETVPFPAFDPEDHAATTATIPLPVMLDEFERMRVANLNELAARISSPDLARVGMHPKFGRVTLAQLLATWTAHDLSHLGQVVRTMAAQYGESVGPWRPMLRILDTR